MSQIQPRSEGEALLDQATPSPLLLLVPLLALVLDVAVVASGFSSQTVWYVIRASGIVAYVLLTLSVLAGLTITNRVLPSGQPRVDAFEVHSFTALLIFGFVSVHVVALLLDSFIGFSPLQVLIPFTSDYRPLAAGAGILGLYSTGVVYASLWVRKRIGYKTWRTLHYLSFVAFILATLHGTFSGADTGTAWMILIYAVAAVTVALMTLRRVMAVTKRLSPA
jgi:sulfoxide reductase heme-binding subunit YedZ